MVHQHTDAVRDYEWLGYYERFAYFSPQNVRDGCYPRILEHSGPVEKASVLVHGLSDSPWFMTAIGDYFFHHLGYNVYLPLLHCHGLKEPNGMEEAELEEWKSNTSFAINAAAAKAGEISIGGLSTGGALSFYMAAINPKIQGALYLFSAALDLAGGPFGLIGEIKEKLLLTFLADLLDFNSPLIGDIHTGTAMLIWMERRSLPGLSRRPTLSSKDSIAGFPSQSGSLLPIRSLIRQLILLALKPCGTSLFPSGSTFSEFLKSLACPMQVSCSNNRS
ncbi:MAG TPA: hypothetical protein ENL01_02950 [Chlorobaculum parvum]|uniref:Serine aminopeptidase S33 domain-containing protein n=1 Tax=Chlorobaculum parvum TaxID=274539 RepID=A0A7C5DG98_9CHLB|nr:hypothetical protein [Chlorobaculum parvum]